METSEKVQSLLDAIRDGRTELAIFESDLASAQRHIDESKQHIKGLELRVAEETAVFWVMACDLKNPTECSIFPIAEGIEVDSGWNSVLTLHEHETERIGTLVRDSGKLTQGRYIGLFEIVVYIDCVCVTVVDKPSARMQEEFLKFCRRKNDPRLTGAND